MPSNQVVAKQIAERYYSQKDRDKMDASDFAGPHQSFPIKTQQDVYNAARLIGHADDPDTVKRRIIAIAKRKGFALPDSWQEENDKPKEAAAMPSTAKLATMITCFLEDDAISLNGRQYPREAVDQLIRSAQVQISNGDALPITCYLSHQEADEDNTLHLVGRVTKVWREGTKALASIDIPATHAGRDLVTLVGGQYIKSTSLRASGAEMRMDRDHTFPQVGGTGLKLEGIDFTTTPGLAQTARIIDLVLAESAAPTTVREVFHHSSSVLLEKEASMPLNEEYIHPIATGDSPSMSGSPGGDYGLMQTPAVRSLADVSSVGTATDESHRAVHDHLANVLDACIAPMHGQSQEAARQASGLVTEAGRKLAMAHAQHLIAAHDLAAHHAGMECEGAYAGHMAKPDNAPGNDGMQDADDDDRESVTSRKRKESPMNPQEAMRLLQEAGYKVEAPKTEAQLLQEQLAAQQAQLEELKKLIVERTPPAQAAPQRRSLVEGANAETRQRTYYRNGDYLREKMRDLDRRELLDRSRPLPEWMDPERALAEFQLELLGLYDQTYGLVG